MYVDIYLDVIMNIDTAIVTIVTCKTFCTELKPIESPLLQIDSSMTVSIILGTELVPSGWTHIIGQINLSLPDIS